MMKYYTAKSLIDKLNKFKEHVANIDLEAANRYRDGAYDTAIEQYRQIREGELDLEVLHDPDNVLRNVMMLAHLDATDTARKKKVNIINTKPGDIIRPKRAPLRVHINQHNIRANKKDKQNRNVITIKRGTDNFYANSIETKGPVTILYQQETPILSCGAHVIMETTDPIEIIK